MATLTRIAELPDSLTPLDTQLAQDARNLFGYQPGIAAVQRTTQQKRLIQELLDLGIRPFSEASVARYKAAQLRNQWLKMFGSMALSVGVGVGGAFMIGYRHPSLLAGALFATGVVGVFVAMFYYQPLNWKWKRIGIRHYDLPIPAHVLATAVQIHTALASKLSIALSVDVFRVDETVYDPDPFLVVTNELGAVAYVEVWDEPSFTAVRKDA